jgi:YD repeat-containing protein
LPDRLEDADDGLVVGGKFLLQRVRFGGQFLVRGNLTGITDARSQTTTMGYNAQRQLSSLTDALTHATGFGYDRGDLSTVTDALSRTSNFSADSLGRTTAVRVPLGNRILTTFDLRDRPTTGSWTSCSAISVSPRSICATTGD